MVHSVIYYRLNTSIIPDSTWDMWAKELIELQEKYPYIASKTAYAKLFKDFDGSTGYHLTNEPEIISKARYLHERANLYVNRGVKGRDKENLQRKNRKANKRKKRNTKKR